jgi:hypothetical protein
MRGGSTRGDSTAQMRPGFRRHRQEAAPKGLGLGDHFTLSPPPKGIA